MSPRLGAALREMRHELERTNFAGRSVSLAEGALVGLTIIGITARRGSRIDAAALAGVTALGLIDDIVEPRRRRAGDAVAKGLRGHMGALRRGRVTTGGAKLIGIPLLCLASAAMAPAPRRPLLEGALAAGMANLVNLLDLRPGRALKVVVPATLAIAVVPIAHDAAAEDGENGEGGHRSRSGQRLAIAAAIPGLLALPADLRERGMLGDGGANVLGAALGGALTRRLPPTASAIVLAGVIALTLASERVSFSHVIAETPWLARLDAIGRLPQPEAGR